MGAQKISSGEYGARLKAICELIFLPAYSPDLNPIEHWCAQVKTAFESGIPPTTKLMLMF
ncbi:UNVERIFIED_CONTAM: hypothetical protein BEN50_09795 [Euhalothece sp. KZN 001]